MSEQLVTAIVSVMLAIVGLAALATMLSPHAQTASVVQAASGGFAQDLNAAVSPVTGGVGIGSLPAMGGSFSQLP